MSFLVYYLILHLCVSMHACNSRHLGVFHKESGKEFGLINSKTPELTAEIINEENIETKESKLEFPNLNAQKTRKGSDIKVQISEEDNKIGGWKNHGRSTMESKLQDSKEAIDKSNDNSFTEDVVVMDYAQPHRKPPIHNIEP
ncbi:hypothetical protein L1987_25849 [Smallanthus sonchifolius]|uniref:Uncharacterized protein n=1 Tax=Smallanthus sonchifolius TaxID=185202 RepID=A0ACB9IAH0_9ASTR|nr:hypothetical protein L1987_25849 [Smallanthus sonchifolius]